MTTITRRSIKGLIIVACLSLVPSWAHAEGKHGAATSLPRKPAVFQLDVCQPVRLKGASGTSDEEGPRADTAMMCQTKSNVRVLRAWRIVGFERDMFVVGR